MEITVTLRELRDAILRNQKYFGWKSRKPWAFQPRLAPHTHRRILSTMPFHHL